MCLQKYMKYNMIICSIAILGIVFIALLNKRNQDELLTPLQILLNELDCLQIQQVPEEQKMELEFNSQLFKEYHFKAQWEQAEIVSKRQVCLAQYVYGQKSREFANFLDQLGVVYSWKGLLNEAMYYIHECLQIEEQLVDEDDENLLMHWNDLATVYKKRDQFDVAIEILKDIISSSEKINKQSLNLALFYNNLAGCYQNSHKESLKYAKLAVNTFDELNAHQNSNYPLILNTLAMIQEKTDPKSSVELLLKALKAGQLIYDSNHPYIRATLKNLCEMKQNKYCDQDL